MYLFWFPQETYGYNFVHIYIYKSKIQVFVFFEDSTQIAYTYCTTNLTAQGVFKYFKKSAVHIHTIQTLHAIVEK